ncbi:MAG: ribosome small subunit-dependent GTPase A [Betaproteobacteria bacterium]|nr:ribosome small subunit-dependent GTPase A [Betaproteobacteria bacterium]
MAQNRYSPSSPSPAGAQALTFGTVVAAFGRHFEVRTAGAILRCHTRGKKNDYACGDEVGIAPAGDGLGVIEIRYPRRNLLWRSDAFRQKLLAANLSLIVIVTATEPGFSDLLVSRCLVAAESENIPALIVLNKSDLIANLPNARERLAVFAALGYPVIELSALIDANALEPWLQDERILLIGQSGMGKSTLINALIPEAAAAVDKISIALNSGSHTTTLTRLYPRGDGWLVDSPGLQAFGLAHLDPGTLDAAFIEFRPYLGQCRFRDCRHDAEPGCALRAAVQAGTLSERRLEHYHLIRSEIAAARQLKLR